MDGRAEADASSTREPPLPENQAVIPLLVDEAGRRVSEILTAGAEVMSVSDLASGVMSWETSSGLD